MRGWRPSSRCWYPTLMSRNAGCCSVPRRWRSAAVGSRRSRRRPGCRCRRCGGLGEVRAGALPTGCVRVAGGGRKRLTVTDSGLADALETLVEPVTRGDPMSPLRWTSKSTQRLAAELTSAGHQVSQRTVAMLLHERGYSLQANVKTVEGKQHPDRDAQLSHINDLAGAFLGSAEPPRSPCRPCAAGGRWSARLPTRTPAGC